LFHECRGPPRPHPNSCLSTLSFLCQPPARTLGLSLACFFWGGPVAGRRVALQAAPSNRSQSCPSRLHRQAFPDSPGPAVVPRVPASPAANARFGLLAASRPQSLPRHRSGSPQVAPSLHPLPCLCGPHAGLAPRSPSARGLRAPRAPPRFVPGTRISASVHLATCLRNKTAPPARVRPRGSNDADRKLEVARELFSDDHKVIEFEVLPLRPGGIFARAPPAGVTANAYHFKAAFSPSSIIPRSSWKCSATWRNSERILFQGNQLALSPRAFLVTSARAPPASVTARASYFKAVVSPPSLFPHVLGQPA